MHVDYWHLAHFVIVGVALVWWATRPSEKRADPRTGALFLAAVLVPRQLQRLVTEDTHTWPWWMALATYTLAVTMVSGQCWRWWQRREANWRKSQGGM